MNADELRRFEPITDALGHPIHRCAAHLTDGVYLPCVAIRPRRAWVELALRRFDEERTAAEQASLLSRRRARENYEATIETFVAAGNRVDESAIARLEPSPFAIPVRFLSALGGETSMSWTQFVVTMRDGSRFSFGTAYAIEFFDMPAGHTAEDIVQVEPHRREHETIYRERPFFTCFM